MMHVVFGPDTPKHPDITFDTFLSVDIRVGTIVEATPFPEARNPAYALRIAFGEALGILRSSAQITHHYAPEDLLQRQILAVVNFPPRQIGPIRSQVLVLGLPDPDGHVVLLQPDRLIPNGTKLS